jgi:hypothetical protein
MTLAERVKAMPEAERYKFFRAMIEVSEAGRKAGASPQEWARMYADTYNEIGQRLKENA